MNEWNATKALYAMAYAVGRLVAEALALQARDDPDKAAALQQAVEAGDVRPVVTATWGEQDFEIGIVFRSATDDAAEPLAKFNGAVELEEARLAANAYNTHFATLVMADPRRPS